MAGGEYLACPFHDEATPETTRDKISRILVEHHMPTRQTGINALRRLVEDAEGAERQRIKEAVRGMKVPEKCAKNWCAMRHGLIENRVLGDVLKAIDA